MDKLFIFGERQVANSKLPYIILENRQKRDDQEFRRQLQKWRLLNSGKISPRNLVRNIHERRQDVAKCMLLEYSKEGREKKIV